MNKLKDKHGNVYIFTCVIILVIMFLLSAVILYVQTYSQISHQRDDIQQKLDNYLAGCAAESYDSVKLGDEYMLSLYKDSVVTNAYSALGFSADADEITYSGSFNGAMSRPDITLTEENGIFLEVRYTLTVYLAYGGKTVSEITVPITVTSRFVRKY